MSDAKRASALRACNDVLPPLVGLLLRLGLGAGEFAAISRRIFVQSAARHLTRSGRKATHSQIAIITGLTRADVKRILEAPAGGVVSRPWEQHRATRVLKGWRTDPEFLRPDGQPRVLPLRGRSRSFESLTRRYSGDIPPRAMLNELISMGVVQLRRNGCVRLIGHTLRSPVSMSAVEEMGAVLRQLLDTLTNNLYGETPALYIGSTARLEVGEKLLPLLRARVAKAATYFIEQVEDQLRFPPSIKTSRSGAAGRRVQFGVTVFTHETSRRHTKSLRRTT